MAINIITSSNSLTSFLSDADAGAFLLIKSSGYIVSTSGILSAYSATGGSARVTIEGTLISEYYNGAYLFSGDNLVTVGLSGIVGGGSVGLKISGNGNVVTNAGLVYGSFAYAAEADASGVYFDGTDNRLNNTGTITGYRAVGNASGYLEIDNSGKIIAQGVAALYSSGYVSVNNSGEITGYIYVANYLDVTNHGLITGSVSGGGSIGYLTLENDGTITGTVFGGVSTDVVTNRGTMGAVGLSLGADTLINIGTITGAVSLGFDMAGPTDVDTFTNFGAVYGDVYTGSGNDVVDSSVGTITGVVYLGEDADSYFGGGGIDRVFGGTGADTIELGDGRDIYRATDSDGDDDLDAGDGVDTYNAVSVTTAVTINLGAATTGNAVGNDTIAGFENIVGGSVGDVLSGDDGANRIDGQDGADVIFGDDGKDRLIGGLGTDTITGGLGRDILTGGKNGSLESDRFVFAEGDSGTTASTRDVITDFRDHRSNVPAMFLSNPDQINLSAIDANTGVAGDQAFSFNELKGAAFSGTAGSLVWQQFTGFALISGDVNGDGKADFVIQLNGSHGLFTSDFVL